MDLPRKPSARRNPRRVITVGVTLGLLIIGYAPLKHAAISALEVGALAGYRLAAGAPAISPGSLPRRPSGRAEFPPAYAVSGDFPVPDSYREWVFVGGATGLAYGEPARARHDGAPGTFTLVYLEPGAFRHFRETGEFPEGTTFALEMREPTTGVSIAKDGWFAGRSSGVHLAVKDTARLGGWAYFNVDRTGVARRVRGNTCASCHTQHGAVDNVFVQFYPVLHED